MMEPDDFDDDGPMFTVDDDEINIGGILRQDGLLEQEQEEELDFFHGVPEHVVYKKEYQVHEENDNNNNGQALATTAMSQQRRMMTRVGGAAVAGGVTGALLAVPLVAVSVTAMAITSPIVGVTAAGGAAYMAATTCGTNNNHNHNHNQDTNSCTNGNHKRASLDETTVVVSEDEDDEDDEEEQHEEQPTRSRWLPGIFFPRDNNKPMIKNVNDDNKDVSERTVDSSSVEEGGACNQDKSHGNSSSSSSNTTAVGWGVGPGLWIMAAQTQNQVSTEKAMQEALRELEVALSKCKPALPSPVTPPPSQVVTGPNKSNNDAALVVKTTTPQTTPTRTWFGGVNLLGGRCDQSQEDTGESGESSSGSSSHGGSIESGDFNDDDDDHCGEFYDDDDDTDNEAEEEEVVFGLDEDEQPSTISEMNARTAALFSCQELVEQSLSQIVASS